MVIIVQLFAADEDAPRYNVGAGVLGLKIAIAPPVADTIDDACGKERYPHHLHRPDGNADGAEQDGVYHQHRADADAIMYAVDMVFQPVVGRAVTVVFQCFFIRAFDAVQLRALQQQFANAEDLRAVRIFNRFAFRVVLAVNRGPGFGGHARAGPQPEAKEMADHRMQIQRAMRGVTMQVNRYRSDSDMGKSQRCEYVTPPRQVEQSCVHNSPRLHPYWYERSLPNFTGSRQCFFSVAPRHINYLIYWPISGAFRLVLTP